ncbi:MAG: hypothetical protein RRX93_02520 [Bacteroidales bacterium]
MKILLKTQLSLLVLLFCGFLSLNSCSKDGGAEEDSYDWMYGTLTWNSAPTPSNPDAIPVGIQAKGTPSTNSILLIPMKKEDNLAATSVAFLGSDIVAASYHGTNKDYKGRIDLIQIDKDGLKKIVATMNVNARINFITSDGVDRIFAGLDTKNGPILTVIPINGYNFTGTTTSTLRLNGKSVNSLYYTKENGVEYIYTATGGDGKEEATKDSVFDFSGSQKISQTQFLARSGFQKSRVDGTKLSPICIQGNTNNRGKWIAGEGNDIVSLHLSTFNKYTSAQIQYYQGPFKNFSTRQIDSKSAGWLSQVESKNMCALHTESDGRYIYVCAGEQGLLRHKIVKNASGLKDTLTMAGTIANNAYTLAFGTLDNKRLFIASGAQGISTCQTETSGVGLTYSWVLKDNNFDRTASANFLITKNGMLYVAYGHAGVLSVAEDNCFITGIF